MRTPAARSDVQVAPDSVIRPRHWLAVTLLFAFPCADGAANAIQAARQLTSPYVFLVPPLLLAILLMVRDAGRISVRLTLWLGGLLAFAALLLLVQINLFRGVNLLGYAQLWVIFIAFFAVQDLVAHSSDGLFEALRRGIRILHYGLAAYLVIIFLVWYTTGRDLSVSVLILDVPPFVSEYYGFRPSGLSREPAWAGFLLAASFIALYFSSPKDRPLALLTMILGVAALRSGTSFAFAGIAALAVVVQRRRGLPLGRSLLVGVIAAFVLIGFAGGRANRILEGDDPSSSMRVSSASVAMDIVRDSFPIGVGYGNFRYVAQYGDFSNYIDLFSATDYKSDVALLNLVSEFGVASLVLLGALVALYGRGHHPLFWAYLVAILFLAGGLLIPANILIAAALGIRERERLRAPATKAAMPRPVPMVSKAAARPRVNA